MSNFKNFDEKTKRRLRKIAVDYANGEIDLHHDKNSKYNYKDSVDYLVYELFNSYETKLDGARIGGSEQLVDCLIEEYTNKIENFAKTSLAKKIKKLMYNDDMYNDDRAQFGELEQLMHFDLDEEGKFNFSQNELEMFDYLEDLRQSGKTNFLGGSPYLQKKFKIDKYKADKFERYFVSHYGELKKERNWKEGEEKKLPENIDKTKNNALEKKQAILSHGYNGYIPDELLVGDFKADIKSEYNEYKQTITKNFTKEGIFDRAFEISFFTEMNDYLQSLDKKDVEDIKEYKKNDFTLAYLYDRYIHNEFASIANGEEIKDFLTNEISRSNSRYQKNEIER